MREAWTAAYSSARGEIDSCELEIEGTLPPTLRGTLFRNGPGNFERGGVRYKHVLDGDGYVCAFAIDGPRSRARFSSRFVRTPYFKAEAEADAVLFRNTFGTQPDHGNAFNLQLKHPANTNVQSWGGQLYALWEAGLPIRMNPETLASEGMDDLGGVLRGPTGEAASGLTLSTGVERIDRAAGLAQGFTAHPHIDVRRLGPAPSPAPPRARPCPSVPIGAH